MCALFAGQWFFGLARLYVSWASFLEKHCTVM